MEKPPIIKPSGNKSIIRLLKVLAAMFGVFVFLVYLMMPKPPKESKLLENFYANRAGFEQLRDMLQADGNLRRVANWGVETSNPFFLGPPTPGVFPSDRYEKYLALLKQTGGVVGIRNEGEPADPGVVVWRWGWAGDSKHIGICWLKQIPTNQVASLDHLRNRVPYPGQTVFRHVDQNWYLWADL